MENLAEKVDKEIELEKEELEKEEEIELDENGNPIEEKEIEAWMAEDEDDQTGSDTMPVSAHIKAKRKLKGKIGEKDAEIDSLRSEIEKLKNKGPEKPDIELPKRPRRDDFEDDNDYEAALDEYEDKKASALFKRIETEQTMRSSQQQAAQSIEKAIDDHYSRAEKLLKSSGISSDVYKDADAEVRKSVEAIRPKQGDFIVDHMISVLGEGSEKVMYKLGRSKALRGEFLTLLADDPTGLRAATFLGQQKAILLNTTIKKKSSAPDPDTQINGDVTGGTKERILKKKYDEAHKKNDLQAAWNAKKEAKGLKIDTSKW
jgi:hypothetical protein